MPVLIFLNISGRGREVLGSFSRRTNLMLRVIETANRFSAGAACGLTGTAVGTSSVFCSGSLKQA